MNSHQQAAYVTRASVLSLLSEAEIVSVSSAVTAIRLADGDEYLDLQQLERGVRRAMGTVVSGHLLPRRAVREQTWSQILTLLTPSRPPPATSA